ncbi:MAG: hypothetical protein J0665_19060 [Deltaproteobacteria bacterium]|nr:hypothetical protein [Deltaproteobacteria bacterium]
MRVFANLFLILFLADGGFSLVDELVPLLTPLAPFSELRLLLSGSVTLMAAAVYLCLGIDRRLPKRVFLPLIFFAFFCPLSAWFFPPLAGIRTLGLIAAAVQVVLGMLPFYYFRNGKARSLTMPPVLFSTPFFGLKNTLIFSGVSLFIVPLTLMMFLLSAADAYMAGYTSGFMHINPGGLRMTERVYTQGNRTIRLAAMIHMGDKEYYDALAASTASGRSIVLAEGISDDENLLHNSIDYGKMAGFLGLESQKEMHFGGSIIDAEELEAPRPISQNSAGENQPQPVDIFRADADANTFRPPTILILNAIGKQLQESKTFMQGFMALNAWGEKNITPEMSDILMDDILLRRNMVLIRYLDKALVRYDTVVIPWGALHMKGIETEVLKRGFTLQKEQERVSIDFSKLFMSMI